MKLAIFYLWASLVILLQVGVVGVILWAIIKLVLFITSGEAWN